MVQGLGMMIISFTVDKVVNFTPTIYTYFFKFDDVSKRFVTDSQELFDLPFASYFIFFNIFPINMNFTTQ